MLLNPQDILVDSIRTSHVDRGRGEALLLLHGFPENLQAWRKNIPELAQHFRVLALDLVGFGETDKVEWDFSSEGMALFVKKFLDRLGVDQTHVVGMDTGATVALALAASFPERVRRLVIFSGTAYPKSVSALEVRLMMTPVMGDIGFLLFGRLGSRYSIRWSYTHPERLDEEVLEKYLQCLASFKSRVLAVRLLRELDRTASWPLERLKKRCPPLLILWAENERYFYPWVPQRLQEDLPHATLEILAHTGHFIQEEQPEIFNSKIIHFLKQDSGPPRNLSVSGSRI